MPIAVSVASADQLETLGVRSTQDLNIASPGLNGACTLAYAQPNIRAIGTLSLGAGSENPVAIYADGVYYASPSGSLLSLAGIERVEVLKGPQGTLFGRNATGGVIHVITKSPTSDVDGQIRLSYGNYATITADGYWRDPIADGLAAALTMHVSHQGEGYGSNSATGQDANRTELDLALRGKLQADVGLARFTLSGDYNETYGSLFGQPLIRGDSSPLGFFPPERAWDVDEDVQPYSRVKGGGVSLTANVPLGGLEFTSISAYRRSRYFTTFGYDTTPMPFARVEINENDRQFSQEVRLSSGSGSPVTWVVGGYYFSSTGKGDPVDFILYGFGIDPTTGFAGTSTVSSQKAESLAGFGQATINLGEHTRLTGGLRYTTEKRSIEGNVTATIVGVGTIPFGPPIDESARFGKLTYRIALDHDIAEGVLGYLSFNTGFKSGGYNSNKPGDPPYRPEVLKALEGGIKADLLGRKLRFSPETGTTATAISLHRTTSADKSRSTRSAQASRGGCIAA